MGMSKGRKESKEDRAARIARLGALNQRKKLDQSAKQYDRKARLIRLTTLLIGGYPTGLTVDELADKLEVCAKTIYRDIRVLDEKDKVPLHEENHRYFIEPGKYLPPVSFTLPEAVAFFLAARLLSSNSNAHNPDIIEAFRKLNAVIPGQVGGQVKKCFEWLERQPANPRYVQVMSNLSTAWANGNTVRIKYKTLGQRSAIEREVDPYFIQPAALEHANYLIGFCHRDKAVRIFKVERIEQASVLQAREYAIPADFDINSYLGPAWGVSAYGPLQNVSLRFKGELATVARETRWHPSQACRDQADGAVMVNFKLKVSRPFIGFVTSWGPWVEVLSPQSLRDAVKKEAQQIVSLYD